MRSALAPIFAAYEKLRADADALFAHIAAEYPDAVACHCGCSDCCHAVFDLSLVEAMYINEIFQQTFPHGPERSRLLEQASALDRKLTKAKRGLYEAQKRGEPAEAIMRKAAELRMPCPLLTSDKLCVLYTARPITCRLYGVPLAIGGKSHVCGLSRFDQGKNYPTVQLGKIQAALEKMSAEIASSLDSRFDLQEVYVPLSMALLTKYDDAWLGIGQNKGDD